MKRAIILLRVSIAFAFFYAAIGGFLNPTSWIGFFPQWIHGIVPDNVLLMSWGVVEIVIGALVLFLKRAFYPALIAALMLGGIVLFNWGARDIVFRDVSLALSALALALLVRRV